MNYKFKILDTDSLIIYKDNKEWVLVIPYKPKPAYYALNYIKDTEDTPISIRVESVMPVVYKLLFLDGL